MYNLYSGEAKKSSIPHKPLVGRLKLVNKLFHDDTGPRRVFFASYFAALRVLRDRPKEFYHELDSIRDAGYHGFRTFWAVGGYNSFWGGAEVAPVTFTQDNGTVINGWDDYDDLFLKLLDACSKRGLKLALTTGDIQYIFPNPARELEEHIRLAILINSHDSTLIASYNIRNEWYVNSPNVGDVNNLVQMGRIALAVRNILDKTLISTSNVQASQEPSDYQRMKLYSDDVQIHGLRYPGDRAIDYAMHAVAWGEGSNQYRPYPMWQMEPASAVCDHGGCTDPILSREELTALYAMHQITGQASTFFQGNAVVPTANLLESVWGFKELPKLFNKYLPDDIGTWDHGYHHRGSANWWFNDKLAITSIAEGWDYTPAVPISRATVILGDTILEGVTDLNAVLTPGFKAALIIGER